MYDAVVWDSVGSMKHRTTSWSEHLQNFRTSAPFDTPIQKKATRAYNQAVLRYKSTPPTNSTVHSQMKEIHI